MNDCPKFFLKFHIFFLFYKSFFFLVLCQTGLTFILLLGGRKLWVKNIYIRTIYLLLLTRFLNQNNKSIGLTVHPVQASYGAASEPTATNRTRWRESEAIMSNTQTREAARLLGTAIEALTAAQAAMVGQTAPKVKARKKAQPKARRTKTAAKPKAELKATFEGNRVERSVAVAELAKAKQRVWGSKQSAGISGGGKLPRNAVVSVRVSQDDRGLRVYFITRGNKVYRSWVSSHTGKYVRNLRYAGAL